MTAEETIWDFAARRERELNQQIAMFEAEIAKRQYELEDLRRAIEAAKDRTRMTITRDVKQADVKYDSLEPKDSNILAPPRTGVLTGGTTVGLTGVGMPASAGNFGQVRPFLEFELRTIKELIVKALDDHFKQGASAVDLIEFIKNAYGRAVERSSLSPQLSRLKQDGWIEQRADGTWDLTNDKRRALTLYDHPSSQDIMTKSLRKE